jgi:gamma-glutamylcyclotransferase (GGCT)/AIG2-like uncharacterized protein YtfP
LLYFAYASNLSKDYMQSRCPDSIPIKKVALKNYKLVFNQLADILKSKGDMVLGALYVISKDEIQQLDKLEGYPDLYNRVIVEVEDEKGKLYDAIAYTMVDKNIEQPPEHYYNILVQGYEDWKLPTEHLEKARKMS